MEWEDPKFFCNKFEYKGYIPTEFGMKYLIEECEIIEHSQEKEPHKSNRSKGDSKNKKRQIKAIKWWKRPRSQLEAQKRQAIFLHRTL